MAAATVALAIACFCSFGWAVRGHFDGKGGIPAPMALTALANVGALAWLLWDPGTGTWRRLDNGLGGAIANCLMVGGLAVFWWAIATTRRKPPTLAFSNDAPTFLQTSGPYAHVRHPFYLSYLVSWIGAAVATQDPWYWAIPAGMAVLYVHAALMEERKYSASSLAQDYDAYRQRTGMLLPTWHRAAGAQGR